jgi:hypothetical protein
VQFATETGSKDFTTDQLVASLKEIAAFLVKSLLSKDKSFYSNDAIQHQCTLLSPHKEKAAAGGLSWDDWLSQARLARVNLVLFSKYFETSPSGTPSIIDKTKLTSIPPEGVEQIFKLLAVDIAKHSLHPYITKKLLKEIEHLLFCTVSALLNYFVFLKEVEKNPPAINTELYKIPEGLLLQFINHSTPPSQIQEEKLNSHEKQKVDLSLFDQSIEKLCQLLTFMVELCPGQSVKSASTLTTNSLMTFMLEANTALGSRTLNCALLRLCARLHNNNNIKSAQDLTEVTKVFLQVIENSKDLFTVCTAVDGLIELHSEDDLKQVFQETNCVQVLTKVQPALFELIKAEGKKQPAPDEETQELYSDVMENLVPFLKYKKKTLGLN